ANGNTAPILDARKSDTLDKLVSQTPAPQPPAPQPPVQPQPPTDPITPPVVEVPKVPPVIVEVPKEPVPPVPQLPERSIQWGRWVALADKPATMSTEMPAGGDRLLGGDYVIVRSAGREYVAPERSNVSFVLKGGEATIRSADQSSTVVTSELKNGLLSVDFGKASYVTSFDLVSGNEVFNMKADGMLASNGRFGNSNPDVYGRPQENNMLVDGILSNEGGGGAAYLFRRRLDDAREINGIANWGIKQ
ncbi:MAG: hypothetical protein ACREWI_08945, partial [Telluria sp.]